MTFKIEPIITLTNSIQFPLNYTLHDLSAAIVACGVVPAMRTAQLHSCSSEMDVYFLQVSLWGFEYSQGIEITSNQEGTRRVQLKKREGSIELVSLDVLISNLSITAQAPFQIINKTPFSLCVVIVCLYSTSSISSREFHCVWHRIIRPTTNPLSPLPQSTSLRPLRPLLLILTPLLLLLLLLLLLPFIPSSLLLLLLLLLPLRLRFFPRDRPARFPNPSKNTRRTSNPFSPPSSDR